jgi:hypothetical protein
VLPSVEVAIGVDPQFGNVAVVMAVVLRILDWAARDLDRLTLPEELFEAVPSHAVVLRRCPEPTGRPTTDRFGATRPLAARRRSRKDRASPLGAGSAGWRSRPGPAHVVPELDPYAGRLRTWLESIG